MQLGWAVGMAINEADSVKSRLVQPEGFEISERATEFHHIRDDVARRQGQPLQVVLQEFLADVLPIEKRGGKLVSHHLEFDAGTYWSLVMKKLPTKTQNTTWGSWTR